MNKFMMKVQKFVSSYGGRLAALAVLLVAGGAFAQTTDPVGVLETFDVETAGTAVKTIMLTVLGIIGTVYGAGMGYVFLRWVYRKVVGALGSAR